MANKLISHMGLPQSIANIFAARNILTAKVLHDILGPPYSVRLPLIAVHLRDLAWFTCIQDALSLTEFELMELLDVGLDDITSAVEHISEIACPPFRTALLLMEDHVQNAHLIGHLPTCLKGLDDALCGGIPSGALTELVGPAGIGKTQFCLKLALLAALPTSHGGLSGRVIYIDTESKFSSRRMMEIGENSFPELFQMEGKAREMAGNIIVLQPMSLSEFTESLQQIKLSLLQHQVKLLIIDSMAALISGDNERNSWAPRQNALGWHVSFLKSLAEFSQIPIVVTNQVRAQSDNRTFCYPFQAQISDDEHVKNPERFESHLVAALGINWAHAVTIRLVLEADSDHRFIKVAKSPNSPPLAFPFVVTPSGISLQCDQGIEVMGPHIQTIHCQGDRLKTNWDKAWSSFRKKRKRPHSHNSIQIPDKYVSWDPTRFEYPFSEEPDHIKRRERSNLMAWTSPIFKPAEAIVVVSMLLIYTLLMPLKCLFCLISSRNLSSRLKIKLFSPI